MELKVESHDIGGVTLLRMKGRLTLGEGTSLFREAVRACLRHNKNVLLDLRHVAYVDSAGLGELVGSWVSARNRDADIKLLHVESQVKALLQTSKLLSVFECHEDEQQAIASFFKTSAAAP